MGRVKDYLIWHQGKYGYDPQDMSRVDEYLEDERNWREEFFVKDLSEQKLASLIVESPSIRILRDLRNNIIDLSDIHWRQFEEIVATLLEKDGYQVSLGKGTKDGGVDIFAERHIPNIGKILTVWQAKKTAKENMVGINVVRELADTRIEHKASKGIIVTTSFLTRGALERIRKDCYTLDKVDRDDIVGWILRSGM